MFIFILLYSYYIIYIYTYYNIYIYTYSNNCKWENSLHNQMMELKQLYIHGCLFSTVELKPRVLACIKVPVLVAKVVLQLIIQQIVPNFWVAYDHIMVLILVYPRLPVFLVSQPVVQLLAHIKHQCTWACLVLIVLFIQCQLRVCPHYLPICQLEQCDPVPMVVNVCMWV